MGTFRLLTNLELHLWGCSQPEIHKGWSFRAGAVHDDLAGIFLTFLRVLRTKVGAPEVRPTDYENHGPQKFWMIHIPKAKVA